VEEGVEGRGRETTGGGGGGKRREEKKEKIFLSNAGV